MVTVCRLCVVQKPFLENGELGRVREKGMGRHCSGKMGRWGNVAANNADTDCLKPSELHSSCTVLAQSREGKGHRYYLEGPEQDKNVKPK